MHDEQQICCFLFFSLLRDDHRIDIFSVGSFDDVFSKWLHPNGLFILFQLEKGMCAHDC